MVDSFAPVISTTVLHFNERVKTKNSFIRIDRPTHLKITSPACGVLTYIVNGRESCSLLVTPSDTIFIICTSPCTIEVKFKRTDF